MGGKVVLTGNRILMRSGVDHSSRFAKFVHIKNHELGIASLHLRTTQLQVIMLSVGLVLCG